MEYDSEGDSLSSENCSHSDQINSDIEAELYSIIHHDTDTSTVLSENSWLAETSRMEKAIFSVNTESSGTLNNKSPISRKYQDYKSFKKDASPTQDFLKKNKTAKRKSNLLSSFLEDSQVEESSQLISPPKKPKVSHFKHVSIDSESSEEESEIAGVNSDSDSSVIILDSSSEIDLLKTNMSVDEIALNSDSDGYDSSNSNTSDIFKKLNCSMPHLNHNKSKKELWHVNINDMYRSRRHSGRYHERAQLKCTNCNQNGHSANQCTLPKDIKCYICGERHSAMQCPGKICFKCFGVGHDSRRCWLACDLRCTHCKMSGHVVKACPDNWRRYHLTTFGQKIVKAREVAPGPIYCYNCGYPGHFGATCPRPRNGFFTTWPCVISYQNSMITPNDIPKQKLKTKKQSVSQTVQTDTEREQSFSKNRFKGRWKQLKSSKAVNNQTKANGEPNFPRSPNVTPENAMALQQKKKEKTQQFKERRKLRKQRKNQEKAFKRYLKAMKS